MSVLLRFSVVVSDIDDGLHLLIIVLVVEDGPDLWSELLDVPLFIGPCIITEDGSCQHLLGGPSP